MQNKKGISLIVLVITIIVMIILATAIIISISNSGIVNRANEAVEKTTEAQMKQMVTIAWSEAHLKDTTETKDDAYYLKEVKAYLTASGIPEEEQNKYIIIATVQGVSIKRKDMTAPVASIAKGEVTPYTIAVNVTATDSESGIKEYRYYIKKDSQTEYTLKETLTLGTYTFEGLEYSTKYDVKVEIEDNSENVTDLYSEDITTAEVEITTLGSLVASAANYGDATSYSANGIDSWKVFYKQTVNNEEYVYLITSDIVSKSALPDLPKASIIDDGRIEWYESGVANINVTVLTTTATMTNKPLWMANWSNYSTYENGRAASYLAAESYWTAFKSDKYGDNVVSAIGTPTLEMFVASWNQKGDLYNTSEVTKYVPLQYESSGTGYKIVGNTSSTYSIDGSDDELYISNHKYWLSSPGSGNEKYLFMITKNDGDWSSCDCIGFWHISFGNAYGLRPVVCLKSSTPAYVGPSNNIVLVEQ